MTRTNLTKYKQESAQGMVEFALILPILMMLMLGIVEFGRLIFVYASVTSASREGARYGSAVGDVGGVSRYQDCDGIRNAALKAGKLAGLELNDIAIQYDDGTSVKEAACPPTERIDLADRVVVSAGIKPKTTAHNNMGLRMFHNVLPVVLSHNILESLQIFLRNLATA